MFLFHLLLSAIGKIVGQTGLFRLGKATRLAEWKTKFKSVVKRICSTLVNHFFCYLLTPKSWVGWKYKQITCVVHLLSFGLMISFIDTDEWTSLLFIYTFANFSHQFLFVFFHLKCLSDGKSPQLKRTHLSILANLCSNFIWMIPIIPQISGLPTSFSTFFGIVSRAPLIISITITLMFHNICSFLAKYKYSCMIINFYSLRIFHTCLN